MIDKPLPSCKNAANGQVQTAASGQIQAGPQGDEQARPILADDLHQGRQGADCRHGCSREHKGIRQPCLEIRENKTMNKHTKTYTENEVEFRCNGILFRTLVGDGNIQGDCPLCGEWVETSGGREDVVIEPKTDPLAILRA